MSVEVRIEPGRIARLLRARGGIAYPRMSQRTERVARVAEAEAPGSMGSYISWKVQEGPRGLEGVTVCDHPAVRYVLDGTRSHIIRPRRARALRFEVEGCVVFSAYARHPGTRPNPFLQRALRLKGVAQGSVQGILPVWVGCCGLNRCGLRRSRAYGWTGS